MCREAPEEILHLEHLGVPFHRNEEGKLGTRAFGGASQARTYYVADITGQAIMHVALRAADEVRRGGRPLRGVLHDRACARRRRQLRRRGPRNVRDGSMELFEAKNVILATGGNGQAWHPTTNALICTGDGIAMAYRVGAPLMDMEMIQYHPTTLAPQGLSDHRGRPRRGRAPAERQGRAVHGEVRAEQDGARLARRRLARRADRDQRGPRLRRRHRRARHHRRAPQSGSTRRCARSSSSAATSPGSTSPASRSTSSRATTTRWAASRPTSTAPT